jgi:hypothetical protein
MSAATDRVQPLKLEDPETGGDSVDQFPTALDHNEDYVDCRGITLQDDSSDDATTVVSREGDDMIFQDVNNPSPVTLTQLLQTSSFNVDTILTSATGEVLVSATGNVLVDG